MADDEIAELECVVMDLLKQDSADLELEFSDGEVMSTLFSAVDGLTTELSFLERNGRQPSPDDYAVMVREAEFQLDHALDMLSSGARERLSHVIDDIRTGLSLMSSGHINAIEMGRRLGETLGYVESHGGGINPEGSTSYTPYEWARLCRTESSFARYAVERETLATDFNADATALDDIGASVPIHPNCMCGLSPANGPNGAIYMVIQTTPNACELCNDVADSVLTRAGL